MDFLEKVFASREEIECVETLLWKIGIIICCPSYWMVDQTGILERHIRG